MAAGSGADGSGGNKVGRSVSAVPDYELASTFDGLTHAVVNTLHTIAAASELSRLLVAGQSPADAAEPLGHIESECMRAARLLREGREFITLNVAATQDDVDIPALANACADSFAGRVTVVAEPASSMLARGDAGALQRAFLEILGNAFQFGAQQVDVVLKPEASGRSVRISFHDDGEGINQPAARFFKPFFSTLQGEHCGLGLAFAAHIVKAHGGNIGADAAETGAIFWIELPLQAA